MPRASVRPACLSRNPRLRGEQQILERQDAVNIEHDHELAADFSHAFDEIGSQIRAKGGRRLDFRGRDVDHLVHGVHHQPHILAFIVGFDLDNHNAGAARDIAARPRETGREIDYDAVVVTSCPPEMQLQRLTARGGWSMEDAQQRLAAQLPASLKVEQADYVIDTSGTFEETAAQVSRVLARLRP